MSRPFLTTSVVYRLARPLARRETLDVWVVGMRLQMYGVVERAPDAEIGGQRDTLEKITFNKSQHVDDKSGSSLLG